MRKIAGGVVKSSGRGKAGAEKPAGLPGREKPLRAYSISMASIGHSPTQAPQLTQSSLLTSALPSLILIASTGQTLTQDSQPVHLSLLTFAAMMNSFNNDSWV